MTKRTSDEIKRAANRLIIETIESLARKQELRTLPNELSEERGIDYTIEIFSRARETEPKSYGMFYLQNKGTDESVTTLKTGPNAGKISFQLEKTWHIEYFCREIDAALVIVLCDLETKSIYWLPIQLYAERYIPEVEKIKSELEQNVRKSDSIQVYFDPIRFILKDGVEHDGNFELFLADVKESKEYLVNRYRSRPGHYFKGRKPLQGLTINKDAHVIEQLHDYLNHRLRELNFVPVDYLVHDVPIEPNEGASASDFQSFTLKPGNKTIAEFFKTVTAQNGALVYPAELQAVDSFEDKLRKIIKVLRRHGVLYLRDNKFKYVHLPDVEPDKACQCPTCLFSKLNYSQALASVQTEKDNLAAKFKQAYVLYLFGHFTEAISILKECGIKTSEARQHEWYFIAKYNLSKLGISLKHFLWGDAQLTKLSDELRAIEPAEILQHHPDVTNMEFLENVASDKFFSDANTKITTLSSSIREHYYSQLRGGSSSNDHVWQLLCEFDQLESMIQDNYITFEGFSDFNSLFEKVIEGTMASHAIAVNQDSRLEKFSEHLITRFIRYGNADFINMMYKRYELRELRYESSTESEYSFINLVSNFFAELPLITHELDHTTNLFFRQRCHKTFATLMTLAGMLTLDEASLQKIYAGVITFLKTGVIDVAHFVQYVQHFIARKGKVLNPENSIDLLYFTYENFEFYGESFIETLTSQLHVTKRVITSQEFERIRQLTAASEDEDIFISFVHLFQICESSAQQWIREHITKQFTIAFDNRLFYLAAIHEVIEVTDDMFQQYVDSCKIKKGQVSFSKVMGSNDARFPHIGAMLNLAFKLNRDTRSSLFDSFKGIDPYYDWLLNMEQFDYSKFNPRWVTEYETIYYLDQIKKYPAIQTRLLTHVKEHRDKYLQDFYFWRLIS